MSRIAHLPLSARLAAWYALTLLTLLSGFAVFTYATYQGAIRRSFDRHLAHELDTVAPLVRATGSGLDTGALERSPPVATRLHGESATYVRIMDPVGRILYTSPNVHQRADGPVTLPREAAPQRAAATWTGQPARTYLAPLRARDGRLVGWAEVTGVEWTRRDELRDLARVLVLGVLLSVLVALAAGWWLARRALRPVAVLTDAASRMADAGPAAAPGARLPTAFDVRDELTRLAETFNGLLDRIERAGARERRFTADAAHELLTPLATLRSEAEVALRRERDGDTYREVLARVVDEAAQMAATVQALLSLARAEAVGRAPDEVVDLSALVTARLERQREVAVARGLALHAEVTSGVRVAAAEAPLADVIDNLVGNAIKYTPAGGRVTVGLVVAARYASTAFDGEGARRSGGRFNSAGTPVVYAADTLALALFEVAVHLPSYRALLGRVAFRVSIDEALVETLGEADLPSDWRSTPPARAAQMLGDRWVGEGRSVALRVPSVLLPHHRNVILNPAHPDFGQVGIGDREPVLIDPRLIKDAS